MEITYQEYKDALKIVNTYIRQVEGDVDEILIHFKQIKQEKKNSTTIKKPKDIDEELDEKIYITRCCVDERLKNALYQYYYNHNLLDENGNMLIEKLKYVKKKEFLALRNVGRGTLNALCDFAECNNIKIL